MVEQSHRDLEKEGDSRRNGVSRGTLLVAQWLRRLPPQGAWVLSLVGEDLARCTKYIKWLVKKIKDGDGEAPVRLEPREGGERRGRIPQGRGSPGKELGLFPACNLLTLKPNNRITKCTIRSVF